MYILGRMGNASQALRLIVEQLADIPQAIAFVQTQDDEDLWQLLISLALGSAATAGTLRPSAPEVDVPHRVNCLSTGSAMHVNSLIGTQGMQHLVWGYTQG